MPKRKKHGGRKPINVLYRRSVSVTQEMEDKGISDAISIRESAIFGASVKGYLNEIQAYADRAHGGDLAKALSVLVEEVNSKEGK